jgi:hypothetical protein
MVNSQCVNLFAKRTLALQLLLVIVGAPVFYLTTWSSSAIVGWIFIVLSWGLVISLAAGTLAFVLGLISSIASRNLSGVKISIASATLAAVTIVWVLMHLGFGV